MSAIKRICCFLKNFRSGAPTNSAIFLTFLALLMTSFWERNWRARSESLFQPFPTYFWTKVSPKVFRCARSWAFLYQKGPVISFVSSRGFPAPCRLTVPLVCTETISPSLAHTKLLDSPLYWRPQHVSYPLNASSTKRIRSRRNNQKRSNSSIVFENNK